MRVLYDSYDEDMVKNAGQQTTLPEGYKWVNNTSLYRGYSCFLYQAARLFSIIYCCMVSKVTFENHAAIPQEADKGYILYGNHTQPIGDVFAPVRALPFLKKKRLHIVASPANLGIPVLGKLLPAMGAMPLPDSLKGMKRFRKAINMRIQQGRCIVIYPEAHLWPYCTEIRPFAKGSFRFPVENGTPAFCMTTTYQKVAGRRKPGITIYIDGPFYGDESLPVKQQADMLAEQIRCCMTERSKNNTCQYIEYVRRKR